VTVVDSSALSFEETVSALLALVAGTAEDSR
jgi:hypothetical protein